MSKKYPHAQGSVLLIMKLGIATLLLVMFGSTQAVAADAPRQLGLRETKAFLLKLKKKFPDESYTISGKADDGNFLASDGVSDTIIGVWKADINNDGIADYALITYGEGSGDYDWFNPYFVDRNGVLREPKFYLQENAWPSNVANPPIVSEHGKTYVLLEGVHSENKKGDNLYAGANSNAARDAYDIVFDIFKYFIKGDSAKLVSKTQKRTRLLE